MVIVLSEGPFLTWNTAMQQSGSDAAVRSQGNLNSISAVGAEEVTDGNIISGMYPDISTSHGPIIGLRLRRTTSIKRQTTSTASVVSNMGRLHRLRSDRIHHRG